MKISDSTSAVSAPAKAGTEEPARSTAPVERVSTAQSAQIPSVVASVQGLAPASRAEHIAEIARAVKSGQYPVNSQAIAQGIVDDAELDAKLQALLQK
jgi:anti-sigma28 factor (negative regulator of flagellin synthesis)